MDFEEVISKLKDVKQYAKENFVPIIRDESAKFMFDFVRKNQFKNILEIGTAVGYSGCILLSASNGHLTTVDKNPQMIAIAKDTFKKNGLEDNVEVFCDDAYNLIKNLKNDGRKYHLIFLDGAKGQYIRYLPILTDLLDENGIIFAEKNKKLRKISCVDKLKTK